MRIGESVCGCWEQFSGSFPLYLPSSSFFVSFSFGTKKKSEMGTTLFSLSSSLPFLFVNIYRYIYEGGKVADVTFLRAGPAPPEIVH